MLNADPPRTKTLTLHLDTFGREALADCARRQGGSPSSVVRAAALHFLADRGAGRPAWRLPRFRRLEIVPEGSPVRIDLDEEILRELDAEAEVQGVTAAQLAEHALIYFLADLDGGRVPEPIGNGVDEDM